MRSINDPSLNALDKVCTKCKVTKTKNGNNFPPRRLSRDGFDSWCRDCHNKIVRQYHANNKEKLNKASREWRASNLEYRRQYDKEYHAEHRETRIEKSKKYRDKNKEQCTLKDREYRRKYPDRTKAARQKWEKSHPEKIRELSAKKRALRKNVEGSFTDKDIKNLYKEQNGKCFYCGTYLKNSYHVDHYIPVSKGGTNWPSNLRLACAFCNLSKGNKMPEDFLLERNNEVQR